MQTISIFRIKFVCGKKEAQDKKVRLIHAVKTKNRKDRGMLAVPCAEKCL